MATPRNTKIVATIGPASSSPEKIRAMISAGMNIARLNFSHGDQTTHGRVIAAIRQIARELHKPIGILRTCADRNCASTTLVRIL